MGPDTGGTVIVTTLSDFKSVNGASQSAKFVFPGYEDEEENTDESGNNPGIVQATLTDENKISCVTPPLKISKEAIEAGTMYDSLSMTTVKVKVILLEKDEDIFFTFTYLKDVAVESFDLPNMHYVRDEDLNPIQETR